MNKFHGAALASLLLAAAVTACSNDSNNGGPADLPTATVTTSTGDLATVGASLTAFKGTLGTANNATVGTVVDVGSGLPTGFRAVNWDAVAAPVLDTDTMPAAQFSNRGMLMQTDGTGFRVDDTNFGSAANFPAFSGNKLFASIGSVKMDVVFNVAGHLATPAVVNAFGVVFVDNEIANTAKIEVFDAQGRSLGVYAAPITTNGKFSFVGVKFESSVIARVRITAGTNPIGTTAEANPGVDLVVMDDFVSGEPTASF